MSQYRKKPVVIDAIRWDGTDVKQILRVTGPMAPGPMVSEEHMRRFGDLPAPRQVESQARSISPAELRIVERRAADQTPQVGVE